MALGLSSRRFSSYLAGWINLYLGDALWVLMVFFVFVFVFVFKNVYTKWIAAGALMFSFFIETSYGLYFEYYEDENAMCVSFGSRKKLQEIKGGNV